MNISRYKWPVIVAAGLHGALLFLYTPSRVVADPPDKPGGMPPPPKPPVVEFVDPEETADSGGGGGVVALPSAPDVPPPADLRNEFTVPVEVASRPIEVVTKLPDPGKMGLVPGPEGHGKSGGPIGIPTPVDLDRVPRAIAQPAPDYPYAMRTAAIDGSVMVEFLVGTDGRVLSAEAIRWTNREFADPAVRAVLRWRFEPGTINGRKVRFRMAIPIEFSAAR